MIANDPWFTARYSIERARYWHDRGCPKTAEHFEQRIAGALAYLDLRLAAAIERYEQTGVLVPEGEKK